MENLKDTTELNRIEKLSFVSLVLQIGSGVSVFIFMLLSLTLLQLSGKLKIDSVLLSKANTSDKIVVTDVFNADMPDINTKITKIMVSYFIETTFSMHFEKEEVERKYRPGGEVFYLTSPSVWEEVNKYMSPIVAKITDANHTLAVDIKDVKNLTGNLWQSRFTTRDYNPVSGTVEFQDYLLNVRIGYYPERVLMANSFTNPLGFAITEFNIAAAKTNR